MKFIAVLLMMTSLSTAFSKGDQARIVEIVPGEKSNEDTMVMWTDGKVTFVSPEEAKALPAPDKSFTLTSDIDPIMSYEPTILDSMEMAQKLLKAQRKPNPIQWNIQCYNMAHVRAYEAWKNYNVKSNKIFLFFTKSYIRKYRGKWWFHVTPMVHVNVDGKVEERVLDREWAKTPLAVKNWTDKFIKSKKACPVIKKYSSYTADQETNHCYVYPAPMYYWQPMHLMEFEESRQEMTGFHMGQVNTAYARDM